MKKLLLLVLLLLNACAPVVTRVDLSGVDKSSSVQVIDLRPATEKESEVFSLLITSKGYGIYRHGDQTLDPPMTQLFRRLAYEKLAMGGSVMPSISIYHMVVYRNIQSTLRKTVANMLGGTTGAATVAENAVNISQSVVDRDQFEKSGAKEYERAFYTNAENPGHAPVFVIYIDAAVGKKRVFVKTMAPAKAPEGQNAYSLAVQSSIQYYLSQYVGN
ncbi:MAG: hypothetical protein LBU53_06060 [Zoogloeaceae bacterium]|jgi:hypothetical protein|nr:hypothetical protein [Zoogloeaceae bacterium]